MLRISSTMPIYTANVTSKNCIKSVTFKGKQVPEEIVIRPGQEIPEIIKAKKVIIKGEYHHWIVAKDTKIICETCELEHAMFKEINASKSATLSKESRVNVLNTNDWASISLSSVGKINAKGRVCMQWMASADEVNAGEILMINSRVKSLTTEKTADLSDSKVKILTSPAVKMSNQSEVENLSADYLHAEDSTVKSGVVKKSIYKCNSAINVKCNDIYDDTFSKSLRELQASECNR
ncbi:MAG TPA: hypothetical protein PLG15_03395 [Candidatus Gastranaerophilaceae bacterium]|nr:hypothetical protein [Candidatus Gastranaerophilaceae bacterium]HPT41408.1 hypothetical protein [Candidatus Gastranaerophilaceae bacterium]